MNEFTELSLTRVKVFGEAAHLLTVVRGQVFTICIGVDNGIDLQVKD